MATDDTNPLVAQRQDTTSTLSGAGVFDDIEQLSEAIDNKSWVSGALAGVALGVDTIAYVSDPLGTLMAWGIGWVFDHIQPFKDWLLQLAGDADQLRANGQTWKNVSATLKAAADNIEKDVRSSFPEGSFTGSAATAYFAASGATTKGIAMTGALSGAVGTAYDVCAVIIQFVHDFVRDAISQVVASILSYAVELVASFGTAFPLVMEQISTKVASLMSGVSKRVTALKESLSDLGTKLTKGDELLKTLKEWLHKLTHGDASTSHGDLPADSAPRRSSSHPTVTAADLDALPQAPTNPGVNSEALNKWADEVAAAHPALSRDEVLAAYDYSTSNYRNINGWLRDSSHPVSPQIPKTVDNLNSLLDKLPSHEGTVYRGTQVPTETLEQALRSGVYSDPAFLSSSTDGGVARSFMQSGYPDPGSTKVLFEIDGHSGSSIQRMSQIQHEAEVLFKSGTKFDILDYRIDPYTGYYFIRMAEQ